ncbi:MAG: helix-turn-helix domain-containing protein, partial [Prevotella sp.]|nr:helix-turn-helix domain-containing protein [Prevotella sp.]
LIFQEIVESETDLARTLGYQKSSFSQIVNGKVPLSEKFVKRLCALDENINDVWILTGEGNMLKTASVDNPNGQNDVVSIPRSVWAVIEAQSSSLTARDRQIDDLISLLRTQITEKEKTVARRDDAATSAAVG